MIVYAGKQFWNDFNNWDEGVFQDASRPRDYDKFKLRPWLQSDKWDWRSANKNTDFSYTMLKWWGEVAWTAAGKQLIWTVPTLQETWTQSELDSLWINPIFTQDVTPEKMKMEWAGNPYVMVKKWPITYQTWDWGTWFTTETTTTTYYEITKSWLYSINCWGKFWFDLNYYDSTTSYQYKEWVCIAQNMGWVFANTDMTQARACGNWDVLRYMQISPLNKWSQLVPMVWHSFTSGDNFVMGAIWLVRLW